MAKQRSRLPKYLQIAEFDPIRSHGVIQSFLLLHKMVDITEIFVFSLVHLDGGRSCVEFLLGPNVELILVFQSILLRRLHLNYVGSLECAAPPYEAQLPFLSLPAKIFYVNYML